MRIAYKGISLLRIATKRHKKIALRKNFPAEELASLRQEVARLKTTQIAF
jgi:hypothetical protein